MRFLKAGYLVSLKTSVTGGIEYLRFNREANASADTPGAVEETFTTKKLTMNPEEHKAAIQVRSKAVYAIRKVAADTPFGYMVPLEQRAALEAALVEAKSYVAAFNAEAKHTYVSFRMVKGLIDDGDHDTALAIAQEAIDALTTLQDSAHKAAEWRKHLEDLASIQSMVEEGDLKLFFTNAIIQGRRNANAMAAQERGKPNGDSYRFDLIKDCLDKLLDMGAEAEQGSP